MNSEYCCPIELVTVDGRAMTDCESKRLRVVNIFEESHVLGGCGPADCCGGTSSCGLREAL